MAERLPNARTARKLAKRALDALDAEKTPDYGEGHDEAVRCLLAIIGKRPVELDGENVLLRDLEASRAVQR